MRSSKGPEIFARWRLIWGAVQVQGFTFGIPGEFANRLPQGHIGSDRALGSGLFEGVSIYGQSASICGGKTFATPLPYSTVKLEDLLFKLVTTAMKRT